MTLDDLGRREVAGGLRREAHEQHGAQGEVRDDEQRRVPFGRKRRQAIDLIVGETRRAHHRRQAGAEGGGDRRRPRPAR